jgi:hypothetical protein
VAEFFVQLVPLFLLSIVTGLIPFAIVLKRLGRSPWWAAISLAPFGIFVMPWVIAFMRWNISRSPKEAAELFN